MRLSEREALRRRFGFRCGYCGVTEAEVGAELTADHYQPTAFGGADDETNWVYSCFACNVHKGDAWNPTSTHRILHPNWDDPREHIAEGPDGILTGLTETGRFHIGQLHLNRAPLVTHRLARRRQAELRQALVEALQRQEELRRRIQALEQAIRESEERLRLSHVE